MSQPVITTDVGWLMAKCRHSAGVTLPSMNGRLLKKSPDPSGFMPSTPMSRFFASGTRGWSKLS